MATSWDTHKNLAVSTIATAPSPATTGTSIVVTAGQGGRFAAGMNATICPAGTTPDPSNSEIVRITAVSTDTLTITRTQESSSARTVLVGDVIFAGPSAKTLTDVETAVNNAENAIVALQSPTTSTQSGSTYTGVLGDANTVVLMTNATSSTFTIPANSSVAYPVGTTITVVQASGAGQVTIAITTDTLNYYSPTSAGTVQTAAAKAAVTLVKTAATTWYAFGAK